MADGGGHSGASDEGGTDGAGRSCPACATPLFERHCKYVCPNHGVVYDCADTFW